MTLGDEQARELIRTGLDQTLFVEAGAGSGKTTSLVDRVVALVLTDGIPVSQVAAVTFTDKAAAELRERLRTAFGERPGPAAAEALADLDTAPIGTLHAFAQRILQEHPIEAGLPPLVDIQDEVASGVTFDARWTVLRAGLLDDAAMTDTLLLALAAGVKLEHLRSMMATFTANWDLIASRVLAAPVPDLPAVDVTPMVIAARGLAAQADRCVAADDKLFENLSAVEAWADLLDSAPDDPARLTALDLSVKKNWHLGRAPNWPGVTLAQLRADGRALAEQAAALRAQVVDATLRRLARHIGERTLEQAAVRRSEGRLEFHDLLVLARELLRSPVHGAQVRAGLQARYRRLLLDEFQDTDPIQIELAVRIAGGATATQTDWADVAVPAGSLFVVGDPKQSIYRFRRADIATYLQAQQKLGREVVLDTNFRTTGPILDWVNTVFAQLIVATPDSQPAYRALRAERNPAPGGPPVLTLGAAAHLDNPNAAELREREAAEVVAAVQTALAERWQVAAGDGWRDIELRDIAVLVPSRTSLPHLESALDRAGIGYHPGATSLVYRSREIRDLLAAARAADDPSDQLALVSALRSPLFGCGDDDLWTWRQAGGHFSIFAKVTLPGHPVTSALEFLRRLHNDRKWLAPSEVLTRIAAERRMFEQAVEFPRTRDVWRRLRFVIDQARSYADVEHGGLREYLAWATRQGSDTARVAEAALPETDADTLKIMTIHSAKGLEFPMVIVSGLTTRIAHPSRGLHVLWPKTGGYAIKLHSTVKTADFDAALPIDEQMGRDEKMRLLYVACTRARDHLVVSLHRKGAGAATSAELIAAAAPPVPNLGPCDLPPQPATQPAVTAPPTYGEWAATIGASRIAAARNGAVTASGLEGTLPSVTDPGLAKGPRDLELPPWHKGRYGTAIGRAVHGVLQSVDLATGEGLASAVAAQALAEGVVPHTDLVTVLARAALASPLVKRAAARPHWRESYVATVVGDRVLEGVVDLLYRDEDGLVIVDYKTDAVPFSALSARVDFYRPQLAAYAAAVQAAAGEPVARCVLLFLHPAGAEPWEVPFVAEAVTAIRASL